MAKVPKIRTPFEVVGGAVAVVEQDSGREIEQCIHAVLSTPRGSRLEEPDFGRPNGLFMQHGKGPGLDAYLAAVEEWEPRAHVVGAARVEDMVEQISVRREQQGV